MPMSLVEICRSKNLTPPDLLIENMLKLHMDWGLPLHFAQTHVDRHGPRKSLQPWGKESPKPEAGLDLQSSWLLIIVGTTWRYVNSQRNHNLQDYLYIYIYFQYMGINTQGGNKSQLPSMIITWTSLIFNQPLWTQIAGLQHMELPLHTGSPPPIFLSSLSYGEGLVASAGK